MNCRIGKSTKIQKNGKKRGKQNYRCVQCGRQFITEYEPHQGYSEEFKRECLKLYVNGMGFRAIERVKGVHNTTIMAWVKEVGELLPNAYEAETIPQVGELDELETFVGSKKAARPRVAVRRKGMLAVENQLWLSTAVDHFQPGILAWVLGDHSAETFNPL